MRFLCNIGFIAILSLNVSECKSQDNLPSGADLFARSIQAIGSEESIQGIKSIHMVGKIKVSEELEAGFELIKLASGKGCTHLNINGQKFSIFVNGKKVWTSNAGVHSKLNGENQELFQQIVHTAILPLEYKKYFDSVKTSGTARFEGMQCYEVECMRKEKLFATYYFSKDTGLEAGYSFEFEGPTESTEVTIVFKNYREVDGLKLPHEILYQYPTGDQTATIERITVNGEVDEKEFEIPKNIE